MRLAEKYKPQKLSEVVGQQEVVSRLLEWLAGWKKGNAMIFHGPPGVGKTALAQALARERNFEVLEVTEENTETVLVAAKQYSLLGKRKVVLLENADSTDLKFVRQIIQDSIFPVILTVDDIYSTRSRSLRASCDVIEFKKIPTFTIEKKLKEIATIESIEAPEKFSSAATGDMRAALIDMDSGLDSRDREPTIFELLRAVFKGNVTEAEKVVDACGEDLNTIVRWIDENVPNEFVILEERAAALELLSKIDVMRKRSRSASKMLAEFSTVHKNRSLKFTSYRPPTMRPIKINEGVSELAAAMHCSLKKAQKEGWLLNQIPREHHQMRLAR